MTDPLSPLVRVYGSEVLGLKQYLCPPSIYDLRFIKGGIPSPILIVVFHRLSPFQKQLLKRIMASIDVFSFSVLEIKTPAAVDLLFYCREYFSKLVCIFGGKEFIKQGFLIEQQKGVFVSSVQKNLANKVSFLPFCDLKELETGDSLLIKNRKQQIWQSLKKWKNDFL